MCVRDIRILKEQERDSFFAPGDWRQNQQTQMAPDLPLTSN